MLSRFAVAQQLRRPCVRSVSIAAGQQTHSANAPSHVAGSDKVFCEPMNLAARAAGPSIWDKPVTHTTHLGGSRAMDLAAGALPPTIWCSRNFVDTDMSGMSVAEVGYRTRPFHAIMERAETSLRGFLKIPDTQVHFFNGGAWPA